MLDRKRQVNYSVNKIVYIYQVSDPLYRCTSDIQLQVCVHFRVYTVTFYFLS